MDAELIHPTNENTDDSQMLSTGFSAHDRQLTIPEEVIVYMNQLNAATMVTNSRIEQYAKNPAMRFIDGKYCIVERVEEKEDVVIMTADWYLIGEFRINGFDEEKMPNDVEFVWGWAIRPGDVHTDPVIAVAEGLDYGMQPLTFPLVKFEDIGIIEIIKAFAFNIMNLECIITKFSSELKSYGIFGLHNIEWTENVPKIRAPEWDIILKDVREMVNKKVAEGMDRKDAVNYAWKQPEILALVADYRRKKDSVFQEKQDLVAKFKAALSNPQALEQVMASNPVTVLEPEINNEQPKKKELDFALASVERALAVVEEEELSKLTSVGDDC